MPGRWTRWQYCGVPIAMPALRSAPRRPRCRAILGTTVLVLGLHALLLGRLQGGAGEAAPHLRALQVRQIVVAAPPAPQPPAAVGLAQPAAGPLPPVTPVVSARPARKGAATGAQARPEPPARARVAAARPVAGAARGKVADSAHAAGEPATGPVLAAAEAADEAAALRDAPPLPVYATRLPPPATLVYALRRGGLPGRAELRWQPGDGQYLLTLDGGTDGSVPLGSSSTGRLDDGGVAPERHVESRRGRALRAVNFRHEAGRISFSGPSFQLPLRRGSQDRLSWMVQLGAVLAAEPALRTPGSEVRLHVVGTRGDAQVWVFAVHGATEVETADGAVTAALLLRRAASRPYDTEVEVWLDPARHHLPVRLRQRLLPAGPETELLLAAYRGD